MSRIHHAGLTLGCFLLGGLLIVATDVRAGAGKGLAYQFKAGDTHAYAVKIVVDRPDRVETFEGDVTINVKSVSPDGVVVQPSAHLPGKMKNKAGAAPGGGKGIKKGGPGAGGLQPITLSGPKGTAAPRVTINPYGVAVTSTGDIGLTYLLGSVTRLVIEPLSRTGEKSWQRSNDVTLRELADSSRIQRKLQGPQVASTSAAKEVFSYEAGAATDDVVRIKKVTEFKTVAGGDVPRIQMTGSGELVFDLKLGVIKSGEYQAKLTFTEENVNVSIPISVSYHLMDAAEVAAMQKEREERLAKAKELAKQAAEGKDTTDEEVTKALAELQAGDTKSIFAARRLAESKPLAERRADVIAGLTEALKSSNMQVRSNAVKAFGHWGTSKEVALVAPLLKDSDVFVRNGARDALVGIKDAKGAEAIAALLPDAPERLTAGRALRSMGPVAEKAVQPFLKHQDTQVRREACKILSEIGTRNSLAALKVAASDRDRLVANEAAAAVRAVQERK